jgi:hypothetical protein
MFVVVTGALSLEVLNASPAVTRNNRQKKMPMYLGQPDEKATGRMLVAAPSINT